VPYYVSWIKDGKRRRFAYPHANLETAIGFANEMIHMDDCTEVQVNDEAGELVADRAAILEAYDEEAELSEELDEN